MVDDTAEAEDQLGLFGDDEAFHRAHQEWQGMPAFEQDDITPYSVVLVQFRSREDMEAFSRLVKQPVAKHLQTRAIWYPRMSMEHFMDRRWRGE